MTEKLTGYAFKYYAGSALLGAAVLGIGGFVYEQLFANREKGIPAGYGIDPRHKYTGNFNPKYYTVVYIKFRKLTSPAPLFTAKHAYFKVNGAKDKVICAIDYLKNDGGLNDCGIFGKIGIRHNFEKFNFGVQQRVYFFVDNEDAQFQDNMPISFTPFGATDDPFAGGPFPRDENHTFYNAEVKQLGDSSFTGLYVENHFKDKDGGKMDAGDRKTRYSINLNLLLCRKGGQSCNFSNPEEVIPIAIDPDTGNGWGNEPK